MKIDPSAPKKDSKVSATLPLIPLWLVAPCLPFPRSQCQLMTGFSTENNTSQNTGKQYSLVHVHHTVRCNCKILSWPLQVAPRVVTLQIRLESINQPVVATLVLV